MNKENAEESIVEFTSDGISKYWNLLNYSNDIVQKNLANKYFSNLKEKCQNYLNLSIELFKKSNSIQDKLISSILIYQYIKENYNKLIDDKNAFNNVKEFLIKETLISFVNESEQKLFESSENSLIIERLCYSISILLILGCFSFWPEAVNEMLNFGKQSIKHTYLITIIFGNCYEELINITISKSQENIIKDIFTKKKEEFKSFINTILINSNKINNKLYNRTIILAKNLVFFEVNTLQIPNMIKIILENTNKSNIDSTSKLVSKCIEYSKCKKMEDEFGGLDLSEYDKKMNKEESLSLNIIIEYIYLYINNNNSNNSNDKDIVFGLGKILSEIIENYIYLLFKKDSISQKLLNLFYYFISNKSRIISQLFFESLLVMKNFINACYRFSNYNQNEKVEFSNYLLKICENIVSNCTFKKLEKQEILFNGNNICISYDKKLNNNNINDEDLLEEIDEIPINEYRNNAEDAFYNLFLIFANNFLKEGVNYFFEQVTKDIIPLIKLQKEEINDIQILHIESIIFTIKSIVNCFETLMTDKMPLIKFTLFMMNSNVMSNNFIFSNFLLLIEEASTYFDYDEKIYSEIIIFLLKQIELIINKENEDLLIQLTTAVLLSICESSEDIYIDDLWQKLFYVYNKNYNQFKEVSLYNLTEAICSSLIIQEEDDGYNDHIEDDNSDDIIEDKYNGIKNENKKDVLSDELLINYFTKIVELPLINIKNICDIINTKNSLNKEKEEQLKKEIIKNFNVLTRILKQSSFIKNKMIINKVFEIIYINSFKNISLIMNEFINNSEIIKPILKMLTKSSNYFKIQIVNKIFYELNELMINVFMKNNENYQSIYVIRNLYSIKLKNIDNKITENKSYIELLDNFLKLNRQICSSILSGSSNQFELILCLSSLFSNIFPELTFIRKEDYVILVDTFIIFIEGIKTICENNIIKSILNSFICLVNSRNNELINQKLNDIVKSAFYSIDHYNNNVINSFNNFCFAFINYDKSSFMNNLKIILYSQEFSFLNDKYKNVVLDYFDFYSNDINKLKNVVIDLMNISKKINVQEILEEYNQELKNKKKDYLKIKNLKNIVVNI